MRCTFIRDGRDGAKIRFSCLLRNSFDYPNGLGMFSNMVRKLTKIAVGTLNVLLLFSVGLYYDYKRRERKAPTV